MSTDFKETMTSAERFAAAVSGKPYDRIPVHLLISDHAARVLGVTVGEYESSATLMARGQAEAFRKYGHDVVNVGPGLTGIPEALGCRIGLPDGSPFVAEPAVRTEKDAARLKVPDPHRDARLPLFLEAAVLLRHTLGNEAVISMTTSGPFTTAAHVRGTDQFLRDLRRDPPFVHRILRVATESIIAFARAAAEVGVRISLADPTASGTMIAATQFREFALPYLTEVVTAVKEATGGPPALHICGNTSKIWREMADTGAGVLSLDNVIDLAEAKAAAGDRAPLLGNIHPTEVMYLGKPHEVRANAAKCLAKAWDTPKGYVLGLGCGLPIDTPPENILALVDAAREYGRWPLDPERFAQ
ncbi:MAG: Uroporphyrinogen decarboxylase [Syntrophorhabdaceae bacterium PtaU1.Bin034]|nr:MAG: Uroporphyrinogen decarboxylase [Syntrophorhabdaceae bacterium PtaU1.Bin034]